MESYNRAYIPAGLFQTGLDLMYSGHEELGWKFIGEAWSPDFQVDEQLIEELEYLLQEGPTGGN